MLASRCEFMIGVKVFAGILLAGLITVSFARAQRGDKNGEQPPKPAGPGLAATNANTKGSERPKADSAEAPKSGRQALTAEQQKQFEAGKAVYEMTCLACHQPHGKGQEGLAPSLVNADWVTGSPERLVRIVLHGMRGPVTVNKEIFELDMPAMGVLEDEQIAAVLTYVRNEWGHAASPVRVETVKKIREATANREDAWTEAELLKIQ